MNLDNKVAVILGKATGKAKTFDYWVRLSTYEKGKPVYMPVQSNEYFDGIAGNRKNFCQLNLSDNNDLTISFIKDVHDQKAVYIPETDKICVDIGLVTAMATDKGDLFGRDFMARLLYYDNRITPLAANRQRQGLPVRSSRYDRRVSELRDYLKNEINRLFNRIVEIYNPAEIVVEKLDFRNLQLSKRMNRLLSRFGKASIVAKLESLEEEFGITIRYENPTYTSQECSVCGYVDKNNRTSQSAFNCKFCHSILHADVNAPRNLRKRSSQPTPFPLYMSHSNILRELTKRFVDSLSDMERKHHLRHSDAVSLLSANPYFAGPLAQLKGY
jgi:putative transposase